MGLNDGSISSYTVSVYELKESGFDFGLDKYEIFDEKYRETLNNTIINTFLWREICYTLPGKWRQQLQTRMSTIMRNKYNALYKAKSKEFDMLTDTNFSEILKRDIDNSSNSKVNSTGSVNTANNSKEDSETETNTDNASSDTTKTDNTSDKTTDTTVLQSTFPSEKMIAGNLSDDVYVNGMTNQKGSENNVENNNTVNSTNSNSDTTSTTNTSNTGTSDTSSTNSNDSNSSSTTQEEYTKTTAGNKSGKSFPELLIKYREFINKFNLDQQVCDDLKDLFINIW